MQVCVYKPRRFAFQVLKQHHKAISDLDWSLENTFLLSAGLDGSVSMWLAASGQLLRVFLTASAALCARFHLVNQNLVMAGTESGVVQVFNCSTGKQAVGLMPPSHHISCSALPNAPLHSIKCSLYHFPVQVGGLLEPTVYSTGTQFIQHCNL